MLEISELVTGYQAGTPVIHGISIKVSPGSISALVGNNGAGKTTTLKAISGLVKPWSGRIEIEGVPITGWKPKDIFMSGVAMVPEGRRIFSGLTVEENLRMGAYALKDMGEVRRRMDRMFDLFPVLADRRRQSGSTLSGGEQQMLALARALISNPKVLLLDEPSMGLAPVLVKRVFESLLGLREQGLAMILVEQNADLAMQISQYAYVLELGSIVAAGPPEELRNSERLVKAYLGI